METQKRLLKYVMVYKARLLAAMVCGGLVALCTLGMAELVSWFAAVGDGEPVDRVFVIRLALAHGWLTADNAAMALIWITAICVPLIHVPKGLFNYLNAYLVASVTNRIGTDVRQQVYSHLLTWPLSYFHKSRLGDIISRMNSDIGLIQRSSDVVVQVIDGPATITACLVMMFVVSWKLTLLAVICVPLMAVVIDRLSKRLRQLTTDTQARIGDVNAVVEESIRGVRIIKSFGAEEREIARFREVNTRSLIAALRAARRAELVLPVVELMGAIAAGLIILVGGLMVVAGSMTLSILTKYTFLAFTAAGAAKRLGRLNVIYQQTIAAADRIFELLDTHSDMVDDPDGVVLKDVQGRVEFDNVSFHYTPGETVLDGVSFAIEPGQVVALVGPSGAGKSTIADLIPRFYDVTGGRVHVDNTDVRRIRIRSLREHIAIVPQDTILFRGTIAENIAYGRPGASLEEIVEVARAANAHDFIKMMPDGYETRLGEGGVGLSGGQRQRISIARALIKDPKILILDEATSSLDAASEGVVQEALERLMKGRSTLVIAHRLSTVTNADRIIVIDRGRIVESGSFSELVARGGAFAQLYNTQFRSEEMV